MQDKYGVEINVGDIVEYIGFGDLTSKTRGTVTGVTRLGISALWEDTARVQSVHTSCYLTVIKPAASIPAEQPTGFTQEDESMLQMLLKRKQEHETKLSIIEYNFERVVSELDNQLTYTEMFDYLKVKSNAEELISVLKAYHEIN
jgi:hypothetical protein